MVKIKDLRLGDVFIYHSPSGYSFLLFVERFCDGLAFCYSVNQSPTIDLPLRLELSTNVYTDLSSFCIDFRKDFL